MATFFALGAIGGLAKEMYGIVTEKSTKISFAKIFISSLTACFIMTAIEDWLTQYSAGLLLALSFVVGILGMELFSKMTSINKLLSFMTKILATLKEFRNFKNSKTKGEDSDVL